jgi:hypothetical protein
MEIPGMNAPAGLDLEAYDSTGRMVGSWKVRDGYLDLSHLPAGIYYLRCRHAGRLYHAKLLIQP